MYFINQWEQLLMPDLIGDRIYIDKHNKHARGHDGALLPFNWAIFRGGTVLGLYNTQEEAREVYAQIIEAVKRGDRLFEMPPCRLDSQE